MGSQRGYNYTPDSNHEGVESTSTTRSTSNGDVTITSYREAGGNSNVHYTEEKHPDGSTRNEHYTYDDGENRYSYGVKQAYTAIRTANFMTSSDHSESNDY